MLGFEPAEKVVNRKPILTVGVSATDFSIAALAP
jgi:hypothetical protein